MTPHPPPDARQRYAASHHFAYSSTQRSMSSDEFRPASFELPAAPHVAAVFSAPPPHHHDHAHTHTAATATVPVDHFPYAPPPDAVDGSLEVDYANYCFSPFDGADDDSGESFTSSSTSSSSAPSFVPPSRAQHTHTASVTSVSVRAHILSSSPTAIPAPTIASRGASVGVSAAAPFTTPIARPSVAVARRAVFHSVGSTRPPLKKRASARSEDERLQRRRAQHRHVDTRRRQKENDAIAKLKQLIEQQQQLGAVTAEADEAPAAETAEDEESESGKRKAGRLSVLEASVAMIEQLTAINQRMEAAGNAREEQVSLMSSHLHSVVASIAQQATHAETSVADSGARLPDSVPVTPHLSSLHDSAAVLPAATNPSPTALAVLPPLVSASIAHSDRSRTLRSESVTFSTLCALVVASPVTGVIVDVNERLLAASGWRRDELVNTCFEENNAVLPLTPLSANRQPSKTGSRLLQQYPASMEWIGQMARGERRKADTLWRAYMRDGRVFEFESTLWAEWDEPLTKMRPPDRMVMVFSLDDAVVVDSVDDVDNVHVKVD